MGNFFSRPPSTQGRVFDNNPTSTRNPIHERVPSKRKPRPPARYLNSDYVPPSRRSIELDRDDVTPPAKFQPISLLYSERNRHSAHDCPTSQKPISLESRLNDYRKSLHSDGPRRTGRISHSTRPSQLKITDTTNQVIQEMSNADRNIDLTTRLHYESMATYDPETIFREMDSPDSGFDEDIFDFINLAETNEEPTNLVLHQRHAETQTDIEFEIFENFTQNIDRESLQSSTQVQTSSIELESSPIKLEQSLVDVKTSPIEVETPLIEIGTAPVHADTSPIIEEILQLLDPYIEYAENQMLRYVWTRMVRFLQPAESSHDERKFDIHETSKSHSVG